MSKGWSAFLAALLLCAMFGLQVTSAWQESPTYDEQGYIARGYAWVKLGDLHMRIGTPILLNALNALPLLSLPGVRLPVESEAWAGTDFHRISDQFMWHVNDNADQILFLARVPTMWLALVLGAFVYRWARELFGRWGGLLALLLCALDPNILAHGRLATTDLGFTALFFITVYWTWKLLRGPAWRHLLAAGISLGLAQATKFSALLLGPILALLFAWRALLPVPFVWTRGHDGERPRPAGGWVRGRLWGLGIAGALVVAVAGLTLWAVYGFHVGPVPGLTSFPVPAPSHIEQFMDVSGRLAGEESRAATAFLMGELYVGGRWDYFPVALALKTPVPTMLLLACALCLLVLSGLRRGKRQAADPPQVGPALWAVWLPPLLFLAISMRSNLNLGYRYVLPVLPFVFVLCGRVAAWAATGLARAGASRALRIAPLCALAGWAAWSGLSIYPHYLAFFNEVAGGPDNGWRYLVDSNLDWGQDLKGLARWMDARGIERIKLGYYGEAYPSYYGIDFEPLPGWPDRWGNQFYRALYPPDPAPGLYAISANLIQGRTLVDPDTYAWFRAREPVTKIGYSIFIYDVPARGEPATLALSGVHLPDVRPEDYVLLGTNDVRVLWFDARRALLAPAPGSIPAGDERTFWILSPTYAPGAEDALPPALAGLASAAWGSACAPVTTRNDLPASLCEGNLWGAVEGRVQALAGGAPAWNLSASHFLAGDPDDHGQALAYPVRFGDRLALLAYETLPAPQGRVRLGAGETLTLVTYWEVRERSEEPVKLFVHLLDAGSGYRGGEDRLDVWYGSLAAGDRFVQVQEIALPLDLPPGSYQVEIGWYNPETMQRLPVLAGDVSIADRVLLRAVEVTPGPDAP